MDATNPTDENRLFNACPNCGQVIDVTAFEPYAKIVCEKCADSIRVRTSFDQFAIKGQIGIGGMSRVFRAVDTGLKREVALKILNRQCSSDEHRVAQFEREARITAAMSHPNVVTVFSSGKDQGYFYIAMEQVTGGSLDDWIRKEQRVEEARMLEVAIDTARGLKAALLAGLIHRDVKPGNILFTEEGAAKIVDFGLALMFEKDVDTDTEIWATPYYVPPEKLNGGVEDHRSDIYSLGASLFHAVLGHPPYENDTNSLEELKVIKAQTVKLSDRDRSLISSESAAILARCLENKPENRYESYDELIADLEYAQQLPGKAKPGSGRGQMAGGFSGPVKAGIAAALVGIAGIGTWLAVRGPEQQDAAALQIDTDPSATSDKTVSAQFTAARDALLGGRFPEASEKFGTLAKNSPQPTANWAVFNDGLCLLFQAKESEARSVFASMPPSGEGELAGFFAEVSRVLGEDGPVPAGAAAAFSTDSFKAMGLLAAGLKNWQLGDWRGARAMLLAFESATPGPSHAWVNSYKELVRPQAADLKLLADMPSFQLENVSPEAAKQAREKASAIAAGLSLPGAVKNAVVAEVAAFGKAVDAHLEAAQKLSNAREAELEKVESQQLAAAVAEAASAAAGMKFYQAVQRLQKERFQSAAMQQLSQDEILTWQQAEDFLVQVSRDAVGYQGEIERLGAAPQVGTVVAATRDGITLRVAGAAGETVIPYGQMPPPALIKIAERPLLADKISDSDEYYRRREQVVAFALKTGQTIYAGMRGNELAKELRGFQARWKRMQPNVEF